MKRLFTLICIVYTQFSIGQNTVEWDGVYQLTFSDFQSPATEIGNSSMYSIHSGSGMYFSFYMSNAEFMFTKNFNSKVDCSFNRSSAALIAPDSSIAMNLLLFARYEFDLNELYARKLRKKLYEGKGTFSSIEFFKPFYEEIQSELSERHALAGKLTDIGSDREALASLHQDVINEINQLSDFCKQCKPPKKKK